MNLQLIKNLCEKRSGGIKQLAADIDMSEANLHRCLNNNDIKASDLEKIARQLNVKVGYFFGEENKEPAENNYSVPVEASKNSELLQFCKMFVENYKERDALMAKLIDLVGNL